MSLRFNSLLLAAALAGLAFALMLADIAPLAAQGAKPVDFQFGVIRGLTTSNLAKENGAFDRRLGEAGARLVWRGPYPGTPYEALAAGQVDATFTTSTNAAPAVLGNAKFKIFGYQEPDLDGEGVWVKKGAGINSLADLKGRKIASDKGGSGHHVLLKALDRAGISPKDVDISYFDPADALAAFNGGQVEAIATWRTFGASAETKGNGVKLVSGRDVGSENLLIYIVREQFAKEHPRTIKAAFDALRESAAESAKDPAATARLWEKLGNLDPKVAPIFVPPASRELHAVTPALIPILDNAANLFVKYGVIPRAPDYSRMLFNVSDVKG
ncbi:ABC transporter substrate-binding protein [Tardiphaga sp.]|uniref:ABC transporter substrate-binding protein n=1 Tax=Tardiphaga sp. TaxID=1926292 RepID=UPI00352ACDFA